MLQKAAAHTETRSRLSGRKARLHAFGLKEDLRLSFEMLRIQASGIYLWSGRV
jgi:hypothetical protein